MKLHLAVNSGFVQMFANIAIKLDPATDHQFVIYGEQMTGQVIGKTTIEDNLRIVPKIVKGDKKIDALVIEASTIYIHFLSNEVIEYLNQFDISNKKIVWFFWGADAFSLPEVYTKLQHYRTDYLVKFLGKCKQFFVKRKSSDIKLDFLKKVDIVAHYSIDDFNLVKPLLQPKTQFKYFTYGVFDYVVKKDSTLKSNDILLGNSASKNNQHIYAIKHLLPKNITQKIYCPLSYGSDKSYAEDVIRFGKHLYNGRFIGITDMLEPYEYYENILSQTEIAIMPQNRSQAWGNIMQLLWQGSKVYMFENNNLYKFLQQKGFHVFELTKKSHKNFNDAIVDVEKNKKLLQQYFGMETLTQTYKETLAL